MNTLSFAGGMARLQQAIAESHDLVVRRGIVLGTLNLRPGERVLGPVDKPAVSSGWPG